MNVVYRVGRVTARLVMGELPDAPAYSTVRTLLGILVRKGWLRAEREGKTLVYEAAKPPAVAAKSRAFRLSIRRRPFATIAADGGNLCRLTMGTS